jgi:exocyst complex component 1
MDEYVEEQVKSIEDQKVKHIKKRKGVLAFMKTFPVFVSNIEAMLPSPMVNNFPIRNRVDKVYAEMNRAMFETVRFIAKDSPVALGGQKSQGQATGDSEDKEILNYHILIIENMHHYLEEVDVKGIAVLQDGKESALKEMAEHLDLYLAAIIRRPLGKLLDFLESTESLMKSSVDKPSSIANHASHSRSAFKRVLSSYDSKEITKGIDALKKRVHKHFGEADDPGLSQNLINKVLRECGERYTAIYERTTRVVADVYEGSLEIEFKREDFTSAFRRI